MHIRKVTTKANATASVVTLASSVAWQPMAGLGSAAGASAMPDLVAGLGARNAVPVTDGSGMNAGTAAQNNPLPGTGALTADLVQSLTYGNGLVYWKNFTQDNRLYQSLVEQGGTAVMNAGTTSADGVNVTQAWDNLTPAETQTFTYSNAGRLASASGAYGTRAWTYDGVGNRLTETKDGVATAWTYAATSNRLLNVKQGAATLRSFVYYPDGSLNADTRGSSCPHASRDP